MCSSAVKRSSTRLATVSRVSQLRGPGSDQIGAAPRAVVDGGAVAGQQQVDVERGHAREGAARQILVPGQKARRWPQAPAAADGVAGKEHAARLQSYVA